MRILALLALFLGLFALFLGLFVAPSEAQVYCRQTAFYDASTNGSTKLVTGQAASSVRLCGFNIWAAGTATVKLVTGTGTACATNETAITPAYSLVTQTGIIDSSGIWRGLLVAPGLDLCIKTSAGVAVQAAVYFVQN